MPKVVDADERRQVIAEATLRVIAREGVESATLGRVAAEAELAVGSVRHYVPTHGEVLATAMERLVERVNARVLAVASDENPTRGADVLAELLPLGDRRREEAAVWLALAGASRFQAELEPFFAQLHRGMRDLVRIVLTHAQESGRLGPGETVLAVETERLAALLDGLALGAVTRPESLSPDVLAAVLARHLDRLGP